MMDLPMHVLGADDAMMPAPAHGVSMRRRAAIEAKKRRTKRSSADNSAASSVCVEDMWSSEAAHPKRQASVTCDHSLPAMLPPEDEEGNVEYKLKLVNPSASRVQHLITQLKWRLREGQGEAIYEIGVEDNGVCAGLSAEEMAASLHTLQHMADALTASMSVLRERTVVGDRHVAEVLLRKVPDNQQFLDLRVAVLGCADAGKSTLLGVITQGWRAIEVLLNISSNQCELDNGRGRARLNLFRHLHEVQTGRTSSISLDFLGFDTKGSVVNYAEHSIEEICDKSTKLITLIDLAGHQKYLKTTIFGLTGYKPHCVMLCVAANMGLVGTCREHLGLALALEMPICVVITKLDTVRPAQVEKVLSSLESLLKGPGCKKIPSRIENTDDAINVATSLERTCVVPIFRVSAVTGKGLTLLERFLNVLPPSASAGKAVSKKALDQMPEEFHIDEIFNVPHCGVVTAGLLSKGVIREGDRLLAGPDPAGNFFPVAVNSIHRNKQACRLVHAGQAASVAVDVDSTACLRKGMVLVHPNALPRASWAIRAKVYILYHPAAAVCVGFQCTVHIGNVCQTATIVDMDATALHTNDCSIVTLVFLKQPEYVTTGSRLLFRERKTKGIGQVTEVGVDPATVPSVPNRSRSSVCLSEQASSPSAHLPLLATTP